MKTFEQRMALIARRSNERLQKRKQQRRRMVAVCIPLVLCLTLGAVLLRHTGTPSELSVTTGSISQVSGASFRVLLRGEELSRGDEAAAAQLEQLLVEISRNQDTGTKYAEDSDIRVTSGEHTYRVILEREDGTTREYSLTGDVLKDLTSSQAHPVTPAQRGELLRLLGITN